MRVYLLIVVFVMGVWVDAKAQDEEQAFLKIVNLIDTGKDSIFSLDGYTFKRGNPVPSGFSSGAFKLATGDHTVTMTNQGADNDKYKVNFTVLPGSTHSILFYAEKEIRKKEGEEIEVYKIKHTALEGEDEIGEPRLTIFSLCKQDVFSFAVRKKRYQVAQKSSIQVPVKLGEAVKITKLDGSLIGDVEIISPFHYVGFIDDKRPDGKLRFTFLEQRKYANISAFEEDKTEE